MPFLKVSTKLITDENLTANELRIYIYILSLYNEEKKCSYPSMEVIAEKTHTSLSTVKRSVAKLIELGYIIVEKRKGLVGNFNIYKRLKHLISNVVTKKKAPKVGVDSNGEERIDGQISVEEALQEAEETTVEINSLDNNSNVRLARSVTNIDNSGFAKKVLSLADEELVRAAIKDFKNKRGKTPTFLVKLLVDQYYKNEINLSGALMNLLKRNYIVV